MDLRFSGVGKRSMVQRHITAQAICVMQAMPCMETPSLVGPAAAAAW